MKNIKKFEERLGKKKLKLFRIGAISIFSMAILLSGNVVLAADDPLSVVNNLSNFIFGLIRAIGMIILAFSVVQIGLSIKSHDPSQRANGFLTFAGGIVITFAKEILNMITGG
ncbi:MAG: glutamyl-tRNA amidotransferase [Firmicutes bacterium]|nr:glutamyl-tRNA amidotransferase [Bacillota bacterium]